MPAASSDQISWMRLYRKVVWLPNTLDKPNSSMFCICRAQDKHENSLHRGTCHALGPSNYWVFYPQTLILTLDADNNKYRGAETWICGLRTAGHSPV